MQRSPSQLCFELRDGLRLRHTGLKFIPLIDGRMSTVMLSTFVALVTVLVFQIHAAQSEMITAPQEITTVPQEMTTAPQKMTTAQQEMTTAQEMPTAPQEMTTAPQEMTTALQKMTTAQQEMTTAQEMPTAPQEMPTAPQEMTTALQEMTTIQQEMPTAPQEMTTAPQEITTVPQEMTTAPQKMTTAQQEMTTAQEMPTAPQEMTTAPQEMTTALQEMTITEEMTTAQQEMPTAPQEMTTAPQKMTTAQLEMTTAQLEMTTAPQEMTTAPQEMTTAPQKMTSAQEMTTAPQKMTTTQEMTTAQQEMTTAPQEMTTAPQETTAAPTMPPPEDLRVTTITGTTVKASWTATTSPSAIGYRVWIREWELPDDLFIHYLSISQTEVTFKDLVPGTEYIISATTINMYIEGPEVQVTAVTETEPPSVLDVEDRTIDSVVISWLPPKGVIVEYSISYTGSGKSTSVTSPGDTHSCALTGLIPGTRYDIDLVAVSRVGRSVAVTTSVITDTDPPSAVEVNSWSATWMVLEWKAPLARVVSYEVTVSQTFGEELFSVDGSETSYNITELLPETHYIIKMAAVGEHGRSVEITCSKQTGPLPLPVDHPTTSTRATTEAHTSVTWRDTTVTSTSFQSTTKRTTATSTETTVQRTTDNGVRTTDNGVRTTDNGVRTTDRQTTTVYSTSKEERPLDKTTYSTSPAQTTESPDEKLLHILQGVDEEQLKSAKPEVILSAMNSINDVLTTSGSAESPLSLSAMEDASALIDKLAGASRGAQSASVTDMANIANALTQSATAVIDKLPEQQPPIVTTASSNILESDLIDVNSADLSPKQQLKMLKEKQKEKEDMQKRAALNIVKSLDSVADTLLALQPGNAEYQTTFGTENVGVTLSRSPSNRDLHLSNGPITATIPSTGSGSQTNSMLDLKMLSFKKNPYSWKQSTGGQNISSPVTVLSMETRGFGKGQKQGRQRGPRSLKEEKQVNLDIPFVPLQERELTTDAPHVTTHKPGERSAESSIDRGNGTTMTYHRFSIPVGNVIPVLHMSWWDVDATFHVYFSYGSKPTFEKYDEKRVIQAKDGYEAWLAEKDVTVTFTPNTTRRGGALYVGVQKIDRGSSSPKKPNRERTANYSLLMSAVGCSSWDEDNERWGLEQCNAKLDIENNIFHCECRTVGSSIAVGTMTLPTPNSIDFLTAFKNFSNLRDNAVVLSIVVSEYILYIINMVLLCANFSRLWGKRSQDQRKKTLPKVSLIPPDRMPAPHLYQITVTTGSMFGAGTTSRVAFQLFGSEGTTPIKMLNPGGEDSLPLPRLVVRGQR
ncbi:uncharacterized protein LOC144903817 [Branchiostoma floridae x Branchiostoma belcheri]